MSAEYVDPYDISQSHMRNSITFYRVQQESVNAEVQRYIELGKCNSYEEFGMVLTSKEIGYPEVRKHQITIPGLDGVLDLTNRLTGHTVYGNREIKLVFSIVDLDPRSLGAKLDHIAEFFHGKFVGLCFMMMDVGEWETPADMTAHLHGLDGRRYYGYAELDPFTTDRLIGRVGINIDCNPYRMRARHFDKTGTGGISSSFVITDEEKILYGTAVSSHAGQFTVNGETITLEPFVEVNVGYINGNNVYSFAPTDQSATVTLTLRYGTGKL